MFRTARRFLGLLKVPAASLAALILLAASSIAQGPPADVLDIANPRVREVMAEQERVTPAWMAIPGVLGTATGLDEAGNPAVVIYIDEGHKNVDELARSFPGFLGKARVTVERTSPFRALKGRTAPVSHKAAQTPPIQLGTSGGWRFDLANGYCCGGTLGALIEMGGVKYILSNYHVFEADIVPGGNNYTAQTGDPIIQPGLIDAGCNQYAAQNVGTLIVTSALPYDSNVDAAIAVADPNMVRADGAILEIGTLSAQTVQASLGKAVKKSGRTTGLTKSSISGVNAAVSVSYDDECAGSVAFTKQFTGQIMIKNRASQFLAGGDSGSLMVEDVGVNPRAVGLLFAGSSTLAVANPINEVLGYFGAAMVGQ